LLETFALKKNIILLPLPWWVISDSQEKTLPSSTLAILHYV